MYIYVIFDPNQAEKPQGNKVVQYFEILNSVRVTKIINNPQRRKNSFLYGTTLSNGVVSLTIGYTSY